MTRRTAARRSKALHPESLLRHPLILRAFTDAQLRPRPRGVDCGWQYAGHVEAPVVGFNPFAGQFFHGRKSVLAEWLKDPAASPRPLNSGDRLVYEVFFGVHDWLHVWAYGLIRKLAPQLELGSGPIRPKDIEALAFAHLLTEACAVVGLDFWYLATIDVNAVTPIGMERKTFATSYHERDIGEYQRVNPRFEVQTPRFFHDIAMAYATGDFVGFDVSDLLNSPMLARWSRHVVEYAQYMRSYIRQWLGHMSGELVPQADLFRTMRVTARWQKALVRDVADALWDLVKHGKAADLDLPDPGDTWKAPRALLSDARFVNVNTLDDDELGRLAAASTSPVGFRWLMDQYVSSFDFDAFDKDKLPLLPLVKQSRDFRALRALMKGEKRVPRTAYEPRDLFLLG
jgi:hypothetical protein